VSVLGGMVFCADLVELGGGRVDDAKGCEIWIWSTKHAEGVRVSCLERRLDHVP
jgi:hypothetical protein